LDRKIGSLKGGLTFSTEVTRMNDVRIACRIPIEDDKAIEKLVKEGKYLNKSDFFRKAIKKLLESEVS